MSIPASQLVADRDCQFDDWGVTVTLREVTQAFDPQSQQIDETYVDTQLAAILGNAPSPPASATALLHLNNDVSFIIKAEELPAPGPASNRRVVYQSLEYDILSYDRSADGLLYTLTCRKTS